MPFVAAGAQIRQAPVFHIPMKPLLLSLIALTSVTTAAEPVRQAGVMNINGERVRLISGTRSADGRYAGACTIRPDKGKPPVDWDGIAKRERGVSEYAGEEGYKLGNVIVDLERGAIAVRLDFSDPYFPSKNHGGFGVAYGPEKDGRRFILAGSAGKWEPKDIRLVELSQAGAKQIDLLKILNPATAKHVAKVRGSAKRYVSDYWITELPEAGLLTGFSDATTLRVPCIAQIPIQEAPTVEAIVELRLTPGPHAEVVSVRPSKAMPPEPAEDHPLVAAADKELNTAYAALRDKLDAAGKAQLLEEQRGWMQSRGEKIEASLDDGDDELANPRFARDRGLLRVTRERTAALRAKAK